MGSTTHRRTIHVMEIGDVRKLVFQGAGVSSNGGSRLGKSMDNEDVKHDWRDRSEYILLSGE